MTDRIHPDDLPSTTEDEHSSEHPHAPEGVRVEYRARVPRHLVGAAFAEAFAIIQRETQPPDDPPALD